ncbi:amidase [Aeromicrobium alkaliterrae]|uniref:Amidase n=1 Tax=Aeromicrobium alkaliterrae TaxID=302168 RepID=A0ABN2JU64_9ACTN
MSLDHVVAAGAAHQSDLLASREISSRELTEATLAAIARENPRINAVVEVLEAEALASADEADRRRADGSAGPLTGVPIALKNDLDVAGHITTLGSRSVTHAAPADGDLVAALRRAGAVPVATTTLPELAIVGFTEPALTGVTRNPIDRGRTSGGSSGGSAALVAAGAVGIATASDGAGSIRIPAASCGLVGFKPTNGTVPGSGGWCGLSTQGCVTPTVADTALYLDAVGTFDGSLTEAAITGAPGALRIGLTRSAAAATSAEDLDPEVDAALERTAALLRAAGHTVVEVDVPYGLDAKASTVRYLGGIRAAAAGVDDASLLEKRTRAIVRLGAPFGRRSIAWAQRAGEKFGSAVHDKLGVDVILSPVMSSTALPVGRWEGKGALGLVLAMNAFYPYTVQWNHAGVPAVSLPAGLAQDRLPLAVQLVARRGDDVRLMGLAAQLEAARGTVDS